MRVIYRAESNSLKMNRNKKMRMETSRVRINLFKTSSQLFKNKKSSTLMVRKITIFSFLSVMQKSSFRNFRKLLKKLFRSLIVNLAGLEKSNHQYSSKKSELNKFLHSISFVRFILSNLSTPMRSLQFKFLFKIKLIMFYFFP